MTYFAQKKPPPRPSRESQVLGDGPDLGPDLDFAFRINLLGKFLPLLHFLEPFGVDPRVALHRFRQINSPGSSSIKMATITILKALRAFEPLSTAMSAIPLAYFMLVADIDKYGPPPKTLL